MNILAIECQDSIIVIDCGSSFPTEEMPGIDLVVPDVTYLERNVSRVKGFFITHGHEDHIGAIPYVLNRLNVPLYATRLTMAIIEDKLREHDLMESVKRTVVTYGDVIEAGVFKVEFIRANHSIADSCMLAISTPAGTIVHTGDFKVDYTPIFGEPTDLQRLGELGKQGVLALLSDSTNAIRPGFTPSERTVADTVNKIFSDYQNSRILIATFASNVDRVQQIINSAVKAGRKVLIEGRSMVSV
ncbi:MAG: ribonuclease J, partial [Lachnospiraceae bacterium]|nr:ribonuclease J [Lachnospiraceae bacterium]